jgi:hypothetical protein
MDPSVWIFGVARDIVVFVWHNWFTILCFLIAFGPVTFVLIKQHFYDSDPGE